LVEARVRNAMKWKATHPAKAEAAAGR